MLKLKFWQRVQMMSALLFIVILSGFTNLQRQIDPPHEPLKGDPDPEVGIVLRLDSTAIDVMRESSAHIRFNASSYGEGTPIDSLTLPFDFKPKKFTLKDTDLGFSGIIYRMILDFNFRFSSKEKSTGIFEGATIYPFDPGQWRTLDEAMVYIDRWLDIIDNAGWERKNMNSVWIPYALPKMGDTFYKSDYMIWTKCKGNDLYEMIMSVTLINLKYKKIIEEMKYTMSLTFKRQGECVSDEAESVKNHDKSMFENALIFPEKKKKAPEWPPKYYKKYQGAGKGAE